MRDGWLLEELDTRRIEQLTEVLLPARGEGVIRQLLTADLAEEDPCVLGTADDFVRTFEEHDYGTLELHKIWIQRSTAKYTSQFGKSVPFVPHIDRQRYAKVMVYLSSVGEGDGAMEIASQNPETLEPLRRSLPDDYKERGLNVVEVDSERFTSLKGARGTAVYFDTNTPHRATPISLGHVREVARFDFWKPEWR